MPEDPEHAEHSERGIHQTVYKQPAGNVPTEATEVSRTSVGEVQAETVILTHSAATSVTGERVRVERSSVRTIHARSLQMDNSAAGAVQSERAVLQRSRSARVAAQDVRLVRSQALLVTTRHATLENAQALVLTGRAEGDVRVAFTLPAAAAFGAAIGAGLAVAGFLLKLAFARR